MKQFLKKSIVIIICLIIMYVAFGIILYVQQDKLIYHPTQRDTREFMQQMPKFQEVSYFLPSGKKVYAWYLKAEKGKQTLVYFHGNIKYAEYHASRLKAFYEAGYGLLLTEYVGYGDIKGIPSQQQMETDAKTAVKYLNSIGISNQQIVAYGHSLGTYSAVYVAAQQPKSKPLNGVILEAPFFSIEQMAKEYVKGLYPISVILKNKHPSNQYIKQINTRLFLAHGQKDKVVPYHHGWQLYEEANHPKTFFTSENGEHSNLSQYGFIQSVGEWLQEK